MKTRTLSFVVLLVLALALVCAAQQENAAKDPWNKMVTVEFKQMPLGDAIDALLKDSGISYTISENIRGLTVSAVLRNVTLKEALNSISRAAGVVRRNEDNVVSISLLLSDRQLVSGYNPEPVLPPSSAPGAAAGSSSPRGRKVVTADCISVVTPKFLNPGDVASLFWQGPGQAQVMTVSGGKLFVSGTKDQVDRAVQLIKSLDTEPALARPIRINAVVEITPPGGAKPLILKTGSVGAEGFPMPLNIMANSIVSYSIETDTVVSGKVVQQKTPQFVNRSANLYMTVTPKVDSPGIISVVGSGSFRVQFPGANKMDIQDINKEFQVAASLESGKPTEIAGGSATVDTGNASFTIKLTATIEKGHVPISPQPAQGTGGYGNFGDNTYLFWSKSGDHSAHPVAPQPLAPQPKPSENPVPPPNNAPPTPPQPN